MADPSKINNVVIPAKETVFVLWLRLQYTLYGDSFAVALFRAIQAISRGEVKIVEAPPVMRGGIIIQGGTFHLHNMIGGDENIGGDSIHGDKGVNEKADGDIASGNTTTEVTAKEST